MAYLYQGHIAPLLVLVVLVVACGTAAPAVTDPNAPEQREVIMRFQWIPQWQFVGYIAAEVNGYYDEVGLDVTLNGGGPEFPAKQIVASGSEQFGVAWADSMYTARQQGVELVALATLFQVNPTAYMVHSDSGIGGVEDFPGKRVAVFYGGGVEVEYRAMLAAAGVDRSTIIETPGEFSMEPFLRRRVDVWPVYATDQPRAVRQQGAEIDLIFARDYGVVMMGDVLFATSTFIEENPNTVRAFVEASLRGWEWALANPEAAVDLVAEYNPELDRDQLTFEASQTIELLTYGPGARCVGYSDPAVWEAEHQMLLDIGVLEAPIPFEQVANNSFVEGYYAAKGIDCEG
ncbi:MAG: ABC transporter substrate-binding protein [Chloroflexaceae bacterium]|nr:ABC transporter substrate-binding protein [Chloroflexaceae bacterium]